MKDMQSAEKANLETLPPEKPHVEGPHPILRGDFGDYEILEEIDRGGMGVTLRVGVGLRRHGRLAGIFHIQNRSKLVARVLYSELAGRRFDCRIGFGAGGRMARMDLADSADSPCGLDNLDSIHNEDGAFLIGKIHHE